MGALPQISMKLDHSAVIGSIVPSEEKISARLFRAFYNGRQGEAAAVSVIGFLILLVCASVYMVYTLRKGDEN